MSARPVRTPVVCPPDWRPGCSCSLIGLEPNEDCHVHGYPLAWQCPYCGQYRGRAACKRCGCVYGLTTDTGGPA